MDWARDYLGNIIQAGRETSYGIELVCPKCGEPVRLRQGTERKPHFAHYSNRAKPDCENYFPSQNIAHFQGTKPHLKNENEALIPKRNSLRCGLFLKYRQELDTFEISLRIPSLASIRAIQGSLEIQSGHGFKKLVSAQLSYAHSVRLAPRVPLLECKGTGVLEFLADHLLTLSRSFTHDNNFFSITDCGGRLLFPGEPLEWGGRYWLVTNCPVTPPDDLKALIEWNLSGSLEEWLVYVLEIPTKLEASNHQTGALLSEFFGRTIHPANPTAYIAQPSPHHFAEDGAYVYPQLPEYMYVRRNSTKEITIDTSPKFRLGIEVTELSDEWVQLKSVQEGIQDAVILIDGIEQVILRIEDCAFFQPYGLCAYAGNQSWDLLDNSPFNKKELFEQDIRVDCRSPRLAKHIAKLNKNCQVNDNFVLFPENTNKELDAGNFGGISIETTSILEEKERGTKSVNGVQLSITGLWLEGVIRSTYGQHSALLVRDYLTNPNQLNMQKLDFLFTSPFMAYIYLAVNNQER